MILRNIRLAQSLTLSHDLQWIDEHLWSPVVSNAEYTLGGALLIESATRLAGRPISLQPPDAEMAWHTRATADLLRSWATVPGEQFILSLDDGRIFTVVFRHHEPPALEADPVRKMATYDADDYWLIKLKFMEI
ncbi:hypothetical protein [Undibacterium sp. TJN19]|uniref:hypothetical protein n=1 Tax=Undibacterium sp. TJN19 TaxID=3413055 RepID=UPI003BF3AEED